MDVEQRAIIDAAQIAKLKVLCLMNENSAAALVYGLPKSDLPEEAPINVVIIDIGHVHTQVSAVAFMKGKLSMLVSSYDMTLGGCDFDELLVNAMWFCRAHETDQAVGDINWTICYNDLYVSATAEGQVSAVDCPGRCNWYVHSRVVISV